MTIESYDYDQLIAGAEPKTTTGLIASGQVLNARTPLGMVTSSGKLVEWNPSATDGSQHAVLITAVGVDASGGDKEAMVYYMGGFNTEALAWPSATDAQKRGAFVGTPITHQMLQD